ncbi:MAG: hypothetical protein K1X38_13365 [Microthrixaceae bacterium]|nr:hypothetical protein [Microthrixaceae bacterium]
MPSHRGSSDHGDEFRHTSAVADGSIDESAPALPNSLLPTRWDALDAPFTDDSRQRNHDADDSDPAFALAPFEPAPFEAAPFEPAPFEAAPFEPFLFEAVPFDSDLTGSDLPSPVPSDPAFAPGPFEPGSADPEAFGHSHRSDGAAPTSATPVTLLDQVYKACFRLLGVEATANSIAAEAVGLSATPSAPYGDAMLALTTAMNRCIGVELPDEARIPFHQHRARLRRDLARRDERDRAILALRHLVVMPPSAVAARLGVPESHVRETTSAWCPEDSRVDSLALLRGIDSWISSDLGDTVEAAPGTELSHLDPPS